MLTLSVINKNENSYRAKLFEAYQSGFNGLAFCNFLATQKGEDEIFKIIHTIIYECGIHDQKADHQRKFLAHQKRIKKSYTVDVSYLFIGKDVAVNQGMQELKALAKKNREKPYKHLLEFFKGPLIF
ncbi:MAG: hypothetical protein WC011_01555 [Candidatus Paceibacterota bacterium]